MIAAEASIHVAASPARVLDFVADLDRYRLAIQEGGLVHPLPDGLERRLLQHRMAAHHLNLLNATIHTY